MVKAEYIATEKILDRFALEEYESRPYIHLLTLAKIFVGLLLLALGGFSWYLHSHYEKEMPIEFWYMLMCIYAAQVLVGLFLGLHMPITLLWHRHQLKKSDLLNKTVTFELSKEGISGNSMGTDLLLPWSFFKVSMRKNGILLRYQKLCYWIPKEAFAKDRDWLEAKEIVDNAVFK